VRIGRGTSCAGKTQPHGRLPTQMPRVSVRLRWNGDNHRAQADRVDLPGDSIRPAITQLAVPFGAAGRRAQGSNTNPSLLNDLQSTADWFARAPHLLN